MPRRKHSEKIPLPGLSPYKEEIIEGKVVKGTVQPALRNISEDMESLIDEYRKIKAQNESNTWFLADLAQSAAKIHGLFQLHLLADENLGTLKQYSFIAGTYPADVRAMFPNLLFTHFRIVASREDRMVWLAKANEDGWSTYVLTKELSRKAPIDELSEIMELDKVPNFPISIPDEETAEFDPKLLTLDYVVERLNNLLVEGKLGNATLMEIMNLLFEGIGIIEFDAIENKFVKV